LHGWWTFDKKISKSQGKVQCRRTCKIAGVDSKIFYLEEHLEKMEISEQA
jgi:hypothetical protein